MNFDDTQLDQQTQQQPSDNIDSNSVQPDQVHNSTEKCLAELSMWQDQCKRISAEFENFKRRVDRDKVRWVEIANEGMLKELVGFIDTFEMALQQKEGVDHRGIEMVHQELLKLLAKYDVIAMQATLDFDPQIHEAIMSVESEHHKPGQIVQVLSKGFMIKDRVLRPAKVSIAI